MADLKPLGRAISQPSAPDIPGVSQQAGSLGKIAEAATNAIGNHIETANNLEASFIYSEQANALNNSLLEALQPANIGNTQEDSPLQRYAMASKQTIDDAISIAPKGKSKELKLKLENLANENLLKVKSALLRDLNVKQKATIESGINTDIKALSDSIQTGNSFMAIQHEKSALDWMRQARQANILDDKDEASILELIKKTKITAEWTKAGRDAENGPLGTSSKIREDFATNDQGLTPTEAQWALESFDKTATQTERLKEGERSKRENEHKALITQALFDLQEAKDHGTFKDQEKAREKYFNLLESAKNQEYVNPQDVARLENEAQNALVEHRTKKEVERLQAQIEKKKVSLEQFALGEHPEKANALKAEIDSLANKLLNLNAITETELFKNKMSVNQLSATARYTKRGMNDALAGNSEQQLAEFSTEGLIEPELTESGKIEAINAYIKGATFQEGLKEKQRALTYLDVSNAIDSGVITNTGQIAEYDLTALQNKQAEARLIKVTTKQNSQDVKLNKAFQRIQMGGGQQDRLEPKEKDAVFGALASELLNIRREETGDSEYQLDNADMLHLYKQMNTDVPALTAQLNYAALEADPQTELPLIQGAMSISRQLSEEAPNVLRSVDSKARSIMTMANSSLVYAQGVNPANAIKMARDAANPQDPAKEAYAKRYRGLSDKDLKKLYKSALPGDPNKNIDTYGQFKNNLELYNATSRTIDDAVESVKQVMQPIYGEDQFFEKDSAGYLPSSVAVPLSNVGNWYSNQIYLDLYGLTKRHAQDPNLADTEKLEWLYPDIPETLTEKKLMNENLHLLGDAARLDTNIRSGRPALQAKWRGQVVDVYYKADGLSRLGDNDRVKYVFYLKTKDNETYYIQDNKSKDGSGYWIEYPQSLPEFLPEEYSNLDGEKFNYLVSESYKAQRNDQNGTKIGTLKQLKHQQEIEKENIKTSLEAHKKKPNLNLSKKTKPNLLKALQERSNE